MKTYIKDGEEYEYTVEHWIESLDSDAYHCNYSLKADISAEGRLLGLSCICNKDMYPVVTVQVVEEEDNQGLHIYLEPSIGNFPELPYSEMEYHDSWSYHIEQWLDAGKLCDILSQAEYTYE